MGKLFFVRKNAEQLLREQNELLTQILAAQTKQSPSIIVQQSSVDTPQVSESESHTDFDFEESDTPFIPSIQKTDVSISTLSTSAENFDAGDVEKLRKAKQDAKK